MSAQFVSLAVGYSLAARGLRRKGARQRPWLELRRIETESTYLDHQVRMLRRSVRQPIRVEMDLIPGRGFYDVCRARIQSPLLERAMEVLANGITEEALQVAGLRGLACLWLDHGVWRRQGGEIGFRSAAEAEAFRASLRRLQVLASPSSSRKHLVTIGVEGMQELTSRLRPHVHRSMRHALKPGASHGLHLVRRLG